MLAADALSKRIGTITILESVSLSLTSGQSLGIMGRNGAGKTTLLKLLSLTARPSSGSISWDGKDVREQPERYRKEVGAVFHHVHLYGELTAEKNLRFYAGMYKIGNGLDRMHLLLQEFGLYHRRHDLVRTFSRGMMQRLSIIRALLHQPKVLLLDEPFTGLDENGCRLFDSAMDRFRKEGGICITVAHSWDQIRTHVDRLLFLSKGRVRFHLPVNEVDPVDLQSALSS